MMYEDRGQSAISQAAKVLGLVLAVVVAIGYYLWTNDKLDMNQSAVTATRPGPATGTTSTLFVVRTEESGQAPLFMYY